MVVECAILTRDFPFDFMAGVISSSGLAVSLRASGRGGGGGGGGGRSVHSQHSENNITPHSSAIT